MLRTVRASVSTKHEFEEKRVSADDIFDPLITILLPFEAYIIKWGFNSTPGEDWSIVCRGAGWLLSHKTCQDCKLHLLKGGESPDNKL